MGIKTKIDWADATWNPVTGCLHGCEYCYARRIAERFEPYEIYDPEMALQRHAIANKQLIGLGAPYVLDFPWQQRNKNGTIQNAPYPFGFVPTFHRYKLDEPQHWKKPRNIFVCSMADLFGEWVPDAWIQEVFEACEAAPQHRYLFLTKNPSRYSRLYKEGKLPHLIDCWWGASTPRMDYSYNIGYKTFASIEPIYEDFSSAEAPLCGWVIIGAETGNRKGKIVPRKEWISTFAKKCEYDGVPVFMKESLRELMGSDFRQEFPWEEE